MLFQLPMTSSHFCRSNRCFSICELDFHTFAVRIGASSIPNDAFIFVTVFWASNWWLEACVSPHMPRCRFQFSFLLSIVIVWNGGIPDHMTVNKFSLSICGIMWRRQIRVAVVNVHSKARELCRSDEDLKECKRSFTCVRISGEIWDGKLARFE
jgi:hypothetical protein